MSHMICFGEVLVDLSVQNQTNLGASQTQVSASLGGAPANVAVALTHLGIKTELAAGISQDLWGHWLYKHLLQQGVQTNLLQHSTSPTPLAFISLDNQGERCFSFYGENTADKNYQLTENFTQSLSNCKIFHFCSNTLTDPNNYQLTLEALKLAREQGCFISFDINFRPSLWRDENQLHIKERISTALSYADLVKTSLEEYEAIFNHPISNLLALAPIIIMTNGSHSISLMLASDQGQSLTPSPVEVIPPKVKAVDTTAAGDSFVAGLLAGLTLTRILKNKNKDCKILPDQQDIAEIQQAVTFGSYCGAYAASHPGTLESLPSLNKLREFFAQDPAFMSLLYPLKMC